MDKFNINTVIEHYGLDVAQVAAVLYPNAKYPKQAFDRVLKDEAQLDVKQVQRLATFIGVPVGNLFSINDWRGTTEDGYLTFVKGDYKAKIGFNGVFVTIYKNNQVEKTIIQSPSAMTVTDFIDWLNNNL